MVNKILLLVRKNLLLRKRHYIVTTLEILLPTLMAVGLIFLKKHFDESSMKFAKRHAVLNNHNETTVFPVINHAKLINIFRRKITCPWFEPDDNTARSSALPVYKSNVTQNTSNPNPNPYDCITRVVAYAPDNALTNQFIQDLSAFLVNNTAEWKPFKNEDAIAQFQADTATAAPGNNDTEYLLVAAIIFEGGLDLLDKNSSSNDGSISYKLRIRKLDGRTSSFNTDYLFPVYQGPGPDKSNVQNYIVFCSLQLSVDSVLVKRFTGKSMSHKVSLQPFPYPPYKATTNVQKFYFEFLPQALVIGFVFLVPAITRAVVSEKETGIRELLKLNGLRGWMQWLCWMLNSLMILVISVTIVVIILFTDFGNGAIILYGDPTVWWLVMLLYVMSASASCFFLCSFFTKPSLATIVGIIFWLAFYFFPAIELGKVYEDSSLAYKMINALIPNMAFHLALRAMCAFEGKAKGAKWWNIAETISSVDSLTLGHMILMLLVDTCLYMFLTIYLENVLPSEFGVRKPWYYIFQLSTYVKAKGNPMESKSHISKVEVSESKGVCEIEPSNADATVGIDIRNLRKDFGKRKIAVDGVSMKMYDGEIFALLGHNGAGKTTTISMLTGMYPPSGGTASVYGYDITKDLDRARDNLGLCPQHNMLFDRLTASEHLRFFGQLKGLNSSVASKETTQLLHKLQLDEKANELAIDLSGGQKRKLSLGIALIGGTKVAILDEPTSGMDPEARRAIWDLLLEMRGHRTILLTTHFMEEADVLGDRIGIMALGKLQCCGTSSFLKKFYGAGYTLKLSVFLLEDNPQDKILPLIQQHVPDAVIKAVNLRRKSKSIEMRVTLPTETATTSVLCEMFTELTKRKDELGINTVGLSLTTMDEVFLRVGELTDDSSLSRVTTAAPSLASGMLTGMTGNISNLNYYNSHNQASDIDEYKQRERLTGLKLWMVQFTALIIKKYIYTYRKWKLALIQLFIPMFLLSWAIWSSRDVFDVPRERPPLEMTMSSYINPVTFASSSDLSISSQFSNVIGPSYKRIPDGISLSDSLLNQATSNLADYREKYIVGFEANSTNLHAMFNTIPNHAAPLAINVASNILLKTLAPSRDLRIRVTNHPWKNKASSYIYAAHPNIVLTEEAIRIPLLFGIFMPVGLALLAASFTVLPTEEKVDKAKQLQMMTGLSPLTYWVSAYLWDFLYFILVVSAMMICFPIFERHSLFTAYGGLGVAFTILTVYGFSSIWVSYIVSLYSRTAAGGFAFVAILHMFSGVAISFMVYVFENYEKNDDSDSLNTAAKWRWFGRLFPSFGASMSTMRFAEIAIRNGRCNSVPKEAMDFLCDPMRSLSPKLRDCCDNCDQLPNVKCYNPLPFMSWVHKRRTTVLKFDESSSNSSSGPDFKTEVRMIEFPGIVEELIFMIIQAPIYIILLMLLEYRVFHRLCAMVWRRNEDEMLTQGNDATDEDVIKEMHRVMNMVTNGQVNEDALVVENLSKSFGSFTAVSKLNYGVNHGECFGLLGINGAGKTTTFRMLTGDETRSFGNAHAFKITLENERNQFLSRIGYCPQFDGVIGVLSGRQMLQLFSRLRGVPGSSEDEANKWLEKMGLTENASIECQKYSGGMKRRLSVAMAMIGDPPLLLLDEPTSGVDPVSRRQFWDVLRSVRDSGQAIILTSHSMEECEALCSRLGIMVNGQLQCLGGVQHLKHKFAQGYTLTVKLRSVTPSESEELESLRKEIEEQFHPCTLKDIHQNVFQYQLHNKALAWDALFKTMEGLKTTYQTIVEDYTLNETSLEEVFLSFARKQYSTRKSEESKMKRWFRKWKCC